MSKEQGLIEVAPIEAGESADVARVKDREELFNKMKEAFDKEYKVEFRIVKSRYGGTIHIPSMQLDLAKGKAEK